MTDEELMDLPEGTAFTFRGGEYELIAAKVQHRADKLAKKYFIMATRTDKDGSPRQTIMPETLDELELT